MKTKLNPNSWHAAVYRFAYRSPLPGSLCPYFWKVMTALPFAALYPVVWFMVHVMGFVGYLTALPFSLVSKMDDTFRDGFVEPAKTFRGKLAYSAVAVVFVLVTAGLGKLVQQDWGAHFVLSWAIAVVVLYAVVLVTVFIIVYDYNSESLFLNRIRAHAKGLCPAIDWGDSDDGDS